MKNLLFAKGLKSKEEYFKLIAAYLRQGEIKEAIKHFLDMPKPIRRECTIWHIGYKGIKTAHVAELIKTL